MNIRYREEVLNVVLALLLHRRGIVAAPEQILRLHLERGRAMPDVLVHYNGLRVAIEGRTVIGKAAQQALLTNTRERIQQGIAHLGIAIVYPSFLRQLPFEQLESALAQTRLRFAVVSEVEDIQLAMQLTDVQEPWDVIMPAVWAQGNLENLSELLRRTYEQLVREDVVKRAAESIRAGIIEFSEVILTSPGSIARSAGALGIRNPSIRAVEGASNEEGE